MYIFYVCHCFLYYISLFIYKYNFFYLFLILPKLAFLAYPGDGEFFLTRSYKILNHSTCYKVSGGYNVQTNLITLWKQYTMVTRFFYKNHLVEHSCDRLTNGMKNKGRPTSSGDQKYPIITDLCDVTRLKTWSHLIGR